MNKTLSEAFIIGIITLIIGKLGFYVFTDEKEEEKNKTKYSSSLILFLIGFILHYLIEFIGLNEWYCDKCDKCILQN
jgi:hypothetical protein